MSAPSSTNPSTSSNTSRYLPLMLILFIGSGCAALIYEIVWFQMLQLVIGSTAVSLGVAAGDLHGRHVPGQSAAAAASSARRGIRCAFMRPGIGHRRGRVAGCCLVPAVGAVLLAITRPGMFGASCARGLVSAICLLPPTLSDGRDAAGHFPLGGNDAARACRGWDFFTAATSPARSSAACWRDFICCACMTWRPRPTWRWPSISLWRCSPSHWRQ